MSHEMLKTNVNTKIQEMLRNTIKLLCQNAIDFGLQLTIQGLLGITVDGSEVLLVNIQEHIDKTNGDNMTVSTTCSVQKSNMGNVRKKNKLLQRNTAWSGSTSHVKDEPFNEEDCIELSDNGISHQEEGFQLKQEQWNENTAEDLAEMDDDYTGEEDYTAYENEEQEYDESTGEYYDNAEEQYYEPTANVGYEQQQSSSKFGQSNVAAKRKRTTVSLPRQRSRTAINKTAYDESGGEDKKFLIGSNEAAGSANMKSSSVLSTECHQVFTCSICGQSMRLLSSFLRHKKQHNGAVYRCDICGKVMNRRDNLISHKRRYCTGTNGGVAQT